MMSYTQWMTEQQR